MRIGVSALPCSEWPEDWDKEYCYDENDYGEYCADADEIDKAVAAGRIEQHASGCEWGDKGERRGVCDGDDKRPRVEPEGDRRFDRDRQYHQSGGLVGHRL